MPSTQSIYVLMVFCHINLNLEYAQLHNETVGNNHVLQIVLLFCKLRYCILITMFINYSCMLSTQCQHLTSTQIYLTLSTFLFNIIKVGEHALNYFELHPAITLIVTCVFVALLYVYCMLTVYIYQSNTKKSLGYNTNTNIYNYTCISTPVLSERLYVYVFLYKTSLFVNCIMCMYSGPEAAYYQIN